MIYGRGEIMSILEGSKSTVLAATSCVRASMPAKRFRLTTPGSEGDLLRATEDELMVYSEQ
jgi:hypothetical protein